MVKYLLIYSALFNDYFIVQLAEGELLRYQDLEKYTSTTHTFQPWKTSCRPLPVYLIEYEVAVLYEATTAEAIII